MVCPPVCLGESSQLFTQLDHQLENIFLTLLHISMF
jgi:hypothetical protein